MGLPITTPIDKRMIKGRRLPKVNLQRSLKEPNIGVKKKPTKGESAQTRVICWEMKLCIPISIETNKFEINLSYLMQYTYFE